MKQYPTIPVSDEDLDTVAALVFCQPWISLSVPQRKDALSLALQIQSVRQQQTTTFFLSEAYDIYNARWR